MQKTRAKTLTFSQHNGRGAAAAALYKTLLKAILKAILKGILNGILKGILKAIIKGILKAKLKEKSLGVQSHYVLCEKFSTNV